jgi:hypothetical protein
MSNGVPKRVVQDFAPLLRLDTAERHFPDEPDNFRANTRFRQSNYSGLKDRGWNRRLQQWEDNNLEGDDYTGEEWETIVKKIGEETAALRPGGVTIDGPITRPRDRRNLWGAGSTTGFFLELTEGYGHDESGLPPATGPARIFHDCYSFTDGRGRPWTALAYWFFYTYNWNVISAHEGDWEHITLYFSDGSIAAHPVVVFYAAHNDGYVVSGRAPIWLPAYATEDTQPGTPGDDKTHPVVFVCRFGHPSYPTVDDPGRYSIAVRTWDRMIPSIQDDARWRDYDGAWGEVGEIVHSTGPLGPWFKREADQVRADDTVVANSP